MASASEAEWWYECTETAGKPVGPVDLAAMKTEFIKGIINNSTLVWEESMDTWTSLEETPRLLKLLKTAQTKGRKAPQKPMPSGASAKKAAVAASTSDGWEERHTLDGRSFFYNVGTEALTWDKPDSLKTAQERQVEVSDWCWVKSKSEGWAAKKGKGDWMFTQTELTRLEQDIVMLDHINEAQIIHNIRERYKKNQIYTWCGASKTVLISVNPFKRLPLYTPGVIDKHRHPQPSKPMQPHVYDIANHALNSLMMDGKNQSILISGESGAGKTECAKQCFSFLAETAGSDSNVEQLILSANPLLEAFGNAKTLRNDNSSRFGKWVAIRFDTVGKIIGAYAESFLLEKSRVVAPAKGERNFHIFYQLFSSARHREKYGLNDPKKFRYLSKSECYVVDGVDDAKNFEEMQAAMTKLGFTSDIQSWIFDTVAGILHLGTIKFSALRIDSADGSEIKTPERLKRAAKLLGVDEAVLEKAITHRSIVVEKKVYIPLNPTQALDACDALAKSVYGNLFEWLVEKVNSATAEQAHEAAGAAKGGGRFIGVLDIFGFEIFEHNSFEQLCINYCNEKLQQHFNRHTFKEEESVYIREKVPYEKINFIDNQPVLDMIERKRKGLLPMLDDEVRLPKGSDVQYMAKVDKIHAGGKTYDINLKLRNKHKSTLLFTVVHYAGEVTYTAEGFMDKNKDHLYETLQCAMASSESSYMQELYPRDKERSRKQATVSERFRKQLRGLMQLLSKTAPCYIRCVKPNHLKKADLFEGPLCIEQLRYSGVYEAVTIRKSGYPFRLTHKQFASRYHCTLLQPNGDWREIESSPPQYKEMCVQLLDDMRGNVAGVQLGETMCLYRAAEHRLMELMRHLALERIVPICQRVMRGHLAREMKRRLLRVNGQLQAAIDDCSISGIDEAINGSTLVIGTLTTLFDFTPTLIAAAIKLKRQLLLWVQLEKEFVKLEDGNVADCYAEIVAAIAQATDLLSKKIPITKRQESLLEAAKERLHSCASIKIDPEAEEALHLLDRPRMVAVAEEAKGVAYTNPNLEKIVELLALSEQEFAKLQLKKAIELKDPLRRINREIWLEMFHLKANVKWFRFTKYPRLKDPTVFANSSWKPWGRGALAEGMLKHTNSPLHTSLTTLSSVPVAKKALLAFKCVLGYMGDRGGLANAPSMACELIRLGLQHEELGTEIYLQIMKQLTENPQPESTSRGWALMAVAITFLRPAKDFEWYLVVFLQGKPAGGDKYISTFHEMKYRDNQQTVPSLPTEDEIARATSRVTGRVKRSRFSVIQTIADVLQVAQMSIDSRPKGASKDTAADESEADEEAPPGLPPVSSPSGGSEGEGKKMLAAYDFNPMDNTMIAMAEGDTMLLLGPDEQGWCKACNTKTGDKGYVPMNYLEELPAGS